VKPAALLTLLLYLALSPASTSAADDYVFAKRINRPELKYPRMAQQLGWEGWAYITHTVDTDGTVKDARVLDSNGIDELNRAYIRHVQNWTYQPATYNGEAVLERNNSRVTFLLTGTPRGARRSFIKHFKSTRSAAKKGELELVWQKIEKMANLKKRNLYEELYLQTSYAMYYASTGNAQAEYQHIGRILDFYPVRCKN